MYNYLLLTSGADVPPDQLKRHPLKSDQQPPDPAHGRLRPAVWAQLEELFPGIEARCDKMMAEQRARLTHGKDDRVGGGE